jgi:hypothetical protein
MSVTADPNDLHGTLTEYDLGALPHEVVSYAFDQLPKRLAEVAQSEQGEILLSSQVGTDYGNKHLYVEQTLIGIALQDACREKLSDIETEVEHGERADFSLDELERFRAKVADLAV